MRTWKMKSSPLSALVFAVAAVGLGGSLWSCGRTPPEAKGPQPAESGPRARNDLENARAAVAAIEERARRDGVSYGQLY
jgi:hypothetical protein